MVYYVYCYLDPRKPGKYLFGNFEFDFEPIYIGKGTRNRIRHHLVQRLKKKSLFYNKLNKIIDLGNKPIFYKLFDDLEEEQALIKEVELISLIGRIDIETGPLCNCTEGGDRGFNRTEETRKKLSDSKLGDKNPMFGKTTSNKQKESVRILALSKKGKTREEIFSKEGIENMLRGAANRGKNGKIKSNTKKYFIIDPDGLEYIVLGAKKLQEFCSNNKIKYQLLRNFNGQVKEENLKHKNKIAVNTISWTIRS